MCAVGRNLHEMGGKRAGKGAGKRASLIKSNEELDLEDMLFGDVDAEDEPVQAPPSPAQRKRGPPASDSEDDEEGEREQVEDGSDEEDEGDEVRSACPSLLQKLSSLGPLLMLLLLLLL